MNLRINADDFDISPGVNSAIEKMFKAGRLHAASMICGCGYFDEAVAIAKRNPGLEVGLHFNPDSTKIERKKANVEPLPFVPAM